MNGFNSDLLDGKTKLHFVGIGGSGMFPLVQILHAVGYEITGSDVGEGLASRYITATKPKMCTAHSLWCIPPPS